MTLGDYVDRGPDTRGVLERLLALRRDGCLVALRGNHEQMMLKARERALQNLRGEIYRLACRIKREVERR